MNGKLIVIEGLDGSGKATQTKLLVERLLADGHRVRTVSFPAYDSDSSALVKMYLAGEFGTEPNDVNAYAASCFYAVDRYASFKKEWGDFYRSGGIIIADRYTTSNGVHQCCKLPKEQWDEYLEWLANFEYNLLGIPSPDMVVYLHTGFEYSNRLMNNRYGGDESKKDIHEKNRAYLEAAQNSADYCSNKLGWNVIECLAADNMRSIDDINKEIMGIVSPCLR